MYDLIRARKRGAEAYWNYQSTEDCPTYCSSEEAIEWREGFYEARAIDNGDI